MNKLDEDISDQIMVEVKNDFWHMIRPNVEPIPYSKASCQIQFKIYREVWGQVMTQIFNRVWREELDE